MKQYFPKKFGQLLFVFVAFFLGSLTFHFGVQVLQAETKKEKVSAKSTAELYEEQFQKTSFENIDKLKRKLTDFKSPIVIVNFWATWCIPCMEELPSMVKLSQKFSRNELTIVAFNSDEADQFKNIQKTIKRFGINKDHMEIVPDINASITDRFNISAIPVTIIFQHGKVVQVNNGPVDFNAEELNLKIKKWLK